MVFHMATVRKLQRRGAPSQPSRKVLQDLALEKPARCFVLAQGGEVQPHLQLLFLCSHGERRNHLGIFKDNFVPVVFPQSKRELQPFVSAAWKDAGD